MKKTTLNDIRKHNPCSSGWRRLLKHLGKTEADGDELSFITILKSNGINDAIWCLRVLPDYDFDVMTFKLKCARRVEHLDPTGVAKSTLDVVERFIAGDASKDDLPAYAYAAADAADAADAAAYAYAAYAAAYAAAYDAGAAAAAYAAAAYAADAAAYAAAAADAAAYAAAADAEREYQTMIFKELFNNENDNT